MYILIGLIIVVALFFFARSNIRIKHSKKIKLEGLRDELINLKNGQTDFHFIGIISDGYACTYFYYENQVFNIEFEAPVDDYLPNMRALEKFANENNITVSHRTYEANKNKTVPVVRLEVNTDLKGAVALGKRIELEVFKKPIDAEYEVVP